jgi:uncharacterized membrane protein YhaH (DUF805 family)
VTELLRFWLTFEHGVSRAQYIRHGVALAAVKYGGDVLLIRVGTGSFWTPLDYLQSVPLLVSEQLGPATAWLAPVLMIWTLPFLWIGVTMTVRRLLDAGRSAWWSLFFFVPVVSYLMIALLTIIPSSSGAPSPREGRSPDHQRLSSSLLAIAAGAALGLGMCALSVMAMNSYGLALFMGTPFGMGIVTGFVLNRRYAATGNETHGVVALSLVVVAGSAFLLGIEGAVCLLMIAPLGLIVAMMGGHVGRLLSGAGERPLPGALLALTLLPGAAGMEAGDTVAPLREVRSQIVVDAPPAAVWSEVVAFSPLPEPTEPLFRIGLAYPTHARIEGEGVGAVRYCVFSTGSFVEPITAWEPGVRLAFDVAESPPPLAELSFRAVSPPHLDGYLVPRRGEFRLVDLGDGRTRLEGSTWYEQRLRPEGYWVLFSDVIIARIHVRVLEHIARSVAPSR